MAVAGVGLTPAAAVILNVTVVGPSAASHLDAWPADQPHPNSSNLNFVTGQTVPNLVTVQTSLGGAISLQNQNGSTDVIVDVVGYYQLPQDSTPPPVPSGLAATAGNSTKINPAPLASASYNDTGLTNATTDNYRVRSVDTPGNGSDFSGQVSTVPQLHACGALTANTTWTTGQVLVVTCPLQIPTGVTLTLQAGAVVKFGPTGSLSVDSGQGSLTVTNSLLLSPVMLQGGVAFVATGNVFEITSGDPALNLLGLHPGGMEGHRRRGPALRHPDDVLRRGAGHLEPDSNRVDPLEHGARLGQIRGLRLRPTEVRAKFKYGGNVDQDHRQAVADRLAQRAGPSDFAARAHLLRRLSDQPTP